MSNYTRVVGVIENKGTVPAGGIEIAISLLGDGGATVGAGSAIYKAGGLPVGGKAPWLAQIDGTPSFKEIRTQVQAQPLTGFLANTVALDFKLDGVTPRPPAQFQSARISGQVTNTGPRTAIFVSILGAVYGADGKLVDVNSTIAKLQEIAPGQSAPFELDFGRPNVREIPKYELFVYGSQKS